MMAAGSSQDEGAPRSEQPPYSSPPLGSVNVDFLPFMPLRPCLGLAFGLGQANAKRKQVAGMKFFLLHLPVNPEKLIKVTRACQSERRKLAPIVVVPNHPTLPGLDYLGGLCNHETVGASKYDDPQRPENGWRFFFYCCPAVFAANSRGRLACVRAGLPGRAPNLPLPSGPRGNQKGTLAAP